MSARERTGWKGEGGFLYTRLCEGERERILLDFWGVRFIVEKFPVRGTGRADVILRAAADFSAFPAPPPHTEMPLGSVPCAMMDDSMTASTPLPEEEILISEEQDLGDVTAVDECDPTLRARSAS